MYVCFLSFAEPVKNVIDLGIFYPYILPHVSPKNKKNFSYTTTILLLQPRHLISIPKSNIHVCLNFSSCPNNVHYSVFLFLFVYSPKRNKGSSNALGCHVYLFSLNLEQLLPCWFGCVKHLNSFEGSRLSVSWNVQVSIDYYYTGSWKMAIFQILPLLLYYLAGVPL